MWHIFWRGYSRLRSGREHWAWMVVVEVRQGTLGGDGRGWGPAGNTGRGWSWLRCGREHWAVMVVVEVRQGTLGVDGRGWGPAGNTGRWWSWLRSGRAHWAWMVVVEVRQGAGGEERRRGEEERRRGEEEDEEDEEEQATDIKSNNPHLAGGELYIHMYNIHYMAMQWAGLAAVDTRSHIEDCWNFTFLAKHSLSVPTKSTGTWCATPFSAK